MLEQADEKLAGKGAAVATPSAPAGAPQNLNGAVRAADTREVKARRVKVAASNPRVVAYFEFGTPCGSSELPGSWHIFPD